MGKIKNLLAGLRVAGRLFVAILLVALVALPAVTAKAADRNYSLTRLEIHPNGRTGTNGPLTVYSASGTNWLRYNTNGILSLQDNGTNYTTINQTNLLYITNGGVAYPIKIRQGLIVH